MSFPEHDAAPALPVFGMLNSPGGSLGDYLVAARQTGIATSPPEGLALHWSAQIPGGMMGGSLWRSRSDAERFFATALSGAITEVAHQAAASGDPGPDYRYDFHSVEELQFGGSASRFAGRDLGEAEGAVLVRRPAVDLEASEEGLVMRVRISTPEGPWVYGFWDGSVPAAPRESDEAFELHTLLTVPTVFEQL